MPTININKEPVELFKIIKFEGIADSGGEAKAMITNGEILVNGEIETQKRKKIFNGDKISANGEEYDVKTIKNET